MPIVAWSAWCVPRRMFGERRLRRWVERYGKWPTVCRMISGFRSIISPQTDFSGKPVPRFLLYSAADTFVWTTSPVHTGFLGDHCGEPPPVRRRMARRGILPLATKASLAIRLLSAFVFALGVAPAASGACGNGGIPISLGLLRLCPGGFARFIGTARSDTVNPSISTDFGSIPLSDRPRQILGSFRHSRIDLESLIPVQGGTLKGYYSNDFLSGRKDNSYRLRQLWGEYSHGRWSVLIGQAWSLTRFNRKGVSSDANVFDWDVVDPGYFVGLLGSRTPQIRGSYRVSGEWQVAGAIQNDGNFIVKATRDRRETHLEAIALLAKGRFGFGPVISIPLPKKVRFTTQHFLTKGAGEIALGLAPPRVWTYAGFVGVEWNPTRHFEMYSYDGLVYDSRSSGNRRLWEWTAGISRKVYEHRLGSVSINAQYAHISRATWIEGTGSLRYGMLGLTFNLPE